MTDRNPALPVSACSTVHRHRFGVMVLGSLLLGAAGFAQAQDISTGLAARYSCISFEDVSGNARHLNTRLGPGTAPAAHVFDADRGRVCQFFGSSRMRTDTGVLPTSSAASYAFWLKGTSAPGQVLLMQTVTGAGTSNTANALDFDNGQLRAWGDNGAFPFSFTTSATATPLGGNWRHVVVTTPDGTLANARIYIDGVDVGAARQGIEAPFDLKSTFFLGGRSDVDTGGYIGLVDEVRLYSRALSPADVIALRDLPPEPDTPAAPGFTARASGSLSISWTAPGFGGPITGYVVQRSVHEANTWVPAGGTCATPGTATSCTDNTLSPGVRYVFRVSAQNGSGSSAFSPRSPDEIAATFPDAPAAPTVVRGGAGELIVSWTPPASDGGSPLLEYDLIQSPPGSSICSPDSPDGGVTPPPTTCTATGLVSGQTYTFRVAARNVPGWGSYSENSVPVTLGNVPAAPAQPIATPGNGQITLSWTAPADGGVPISGYTVEISSDGGGSWTNPAGSCAAASTQASTATACTATGLVNGSSYLLRVTAINSVGAGPASTPAAAVPATTPAAPAAPAITIGTQQISLSWTAPTNGGAAITGYLVEVSTDGGGSWAAASGSCAPSSTQASTATTCTATGLVGGTSYVFRVAALNAQGSGAFSTASAAGIPLPGAVSRPAVVPAGSLWSQALLILLLGGLGMAWVGLRRD